LEKALHVASQQGIKSLNTVVNLVWVNTYISGYAMHNSVGIVVCST